MWLKFFFEDFQCITPHLSLTVLGSAYESLFFLGAFKIFSSSSASPFCYFSVWISVYLTWYSLSSWICKLSPYIWKFFCRGWFGLCFQGRSHSAHEAGLDHSVHLKYRLQMLVLQMVTTAGKSGKFLPITFSNFYLFILMPISHINLFLT